MKEQDNLFEYDLTLYIISTTHRHQWSLSIFKKGYLVLSVSGINLDKIKVPKLRDRLSIPAIEK